MDKQRSAMPSPADKVNLAPDPYDMRLIPMTVATLNSRRQRSTTLDQQYHLQPMKSTLHLIPII
jgi:hypothetical protein